MVAEQFVPFDFKEVTASDLLEEYVFFSQTRWQDDTALKNIWKNVRTSNRYRRGKLYRNSWGPYTSIVWVHEDKERALWNSDVVVLEYGHMIRHDTALSTSRDEAKEEAEWLGWLALKEHLEYITRMLRNSLQ